VSVKVVGHQWYWEYQYFRNLVRATIDSYILLGSGSFHNLDVDNRLVIPSLRRILFLVTSADVLHSWTVPSLGIKIDSIPGRLNYLTRMALRRGVYFGQCREICGSNHRFMPISLEVVPVSEFLNINFA
jgi:cytochrome c oxidase subunit 2